MNQEDKMRKNLLESQKQLLRFKQASISKATENLEIMKANYNNTVSMIAEELGIPKGEMKAWQFKFVYFEKIKEKEKEEKPK